MANILLGVTGSVAAIRTPMLFQALTQAGHAVKVVATDASLYFFDTAELSQGVLHRDADEWPRTSASSHYQRDDPVLHIELRKWADLLLIAPLDANTLAKLAYGLCDNCLTCVYRAWDPARPIVLAPAMNTFMWENPLTLRHWKLLLKTHSQRRAKRKDDIDAVIRRINKRCEKLTVVGPIRKQLACGDVGIGGMAEVEELVAHVHARFNITDKN